MAALDSDKVRQQLRAKLGCEEEKRDHYWYLLRDDAGILLSRTKVSLGPKHTIGHTILSKMARQIGLGTAANFVAMVECTLDREDCLKLITAQSQRL